MNEPLAPCPCGQTPTDIIIQQGGEGCKYALVCGNCCNEWMVEFRTGYHELDTAECRALALAEWNAAPRGEEPK